MDECNAVMEMYAYAVVWWRVWYCSKFFLIFLNDFDKVVVFTYRTMNKDNESHIERQ